MPGTHIQNVLYAKHGSQKACVENVANTLRIIDTDDLCAKTAIISTNATLRLIRD